MFDSWYGHFGVVVVVVTLSMPRNFTHIDPIYLAVKRGPRPGVD